MRLARPPRLLLSFVILALAVPGAPANAAPRELGAVRFGRDLGAALAASAKSGKPVLILFQEIPGCATCTSFGDGPLTHPLLVEAIESEFEPVAVHNNAPGTDAAVLARFGEPAWNNPVMRFVDAKGRDVIPRRGGLYGTHEIAARLVDALRAAKRPVPAYLVLAADELNGPREHATFAMSCFWEGQAKLGALDGVTAARPLFAEGHEAVEVTYDPTRLAFDRLLAQASSTSCASRVWTTSAAQQRSAVRAVGDRAARAAAHAQAAGAGDDLHALTRSPLRWLPLTPLQALRVNAAIAGGEETSRWLSPRQRELADGLVAALARNPHAFDGLARPEDPDELGAYAARLTARLVGAKTRG